MRSMSVIFICLFWLTATAQFGGRSVFQSLEMAPSARLLALGGQAVSIRDSDVVMAQNNPAIAKAWTSHQVAFNHQFYYTGSSFTSVAGLHHFSKQNLTLSAAYFNLNHGELIGSDEFGNKTANFSAAEHTIALGASKKLFEPLSIGIRLKYIFASIESYTSTGLAIDLGGIYTLSNQRSHIGITFRNLGTQFKSYHSEKEPLPLDILVGYTHRLKYVPIQLTITAHRMDRWNLRTIYDEPESSIFGEPIVQSSFLSKNADNLFRHLVFGAEIFLGKNAPMRLRISYNHHRHQELKDITYGGVSGLAGGIGIKFSKFMLDYSVAAYHVAGGVHGLGLSYRW